ncbi:thioredoxin reductase [Candidatus Kaiserbacteria bacterium CG10_big_fil_rev_8_21_14_0_10_44_10]|uniref:Thioredoxin reductase n=1 Tax=Candidatus Kaiserbacteria bacterium CG10_big_fil_rev_8_21_14_0_10_44_10 TaxID=1974606 RepID=A0A2H0UJC2_9BACT|nr:MAG: thioredoxin reductase [Candidatus Kaiserbacteria bacterium CG10_big_fil_rev_8_21_14_0_10_44_10]
MKPTVYDLIIIGGGPAGASAGVYASRKQLKTLLITSEWGGQSTVSPDIQNWIGTPSISGSDLAKSFETHLKTYAGDILTIKDKTFVTSLTKDGENFVVQTDKEESFTATAVLVTSGSKRRALSSPGAAEFENKGLTYCASCDGPMFSGQDVAVIGGGNAGFETAAQLLAYAKSVTLIHKNDAFKADPVTVEKVMKDPKMRAVLNTDVAEVVGDKFVSGLKLKNVQTGEESEIAVTGVFVEIGMIPNTEFVKDILPLDEYNRVKIDPWTQKTEVPGVWAAGDCTNIKYHQNNISAGDAVRALEDIYVTLKTK